MVYLYKIININKSERWISIVSNDNMCSYEPDSFFYLLEKINSDVNGKIVDIGNFQYRIEDDGIGFVYQWDSCFGISVIYPENVTEDEAKDYLKKYMMAEDNNLMIKAIVFDIGGTLMEYRGMPYGWSDYYPAAFEHVREKLKLEVSDEELAESLRILREYNPKLKYREIDYSPEEIFGNVTEKWKHKTPLNIIINTFFESMHLESITYPDTIEVLRKIKERGIIIATYTDVATGMPDEMHKSYFSDIIPFFDKYVSSITCGYRKPNPKGLEDISQYYKLMPYEMIMVGDEEKDIVTAQRFGCKSVLIDRAGLGADFGQDITIRTLNELIDYI